MRSVVFGLFFTVAFASAAGKAAAAESGDVFDFLKNTVCTRIPVKGCDVLDVENAENIYKTARYFITQKFCETPNLKQAERLMDIDPLSFPDPVGCQRLIETDKALNTRPEKPREKAAPALADRPVPKRRRNASRSHEANPSLCKILKTCN